MAQLWGGRFKGATDDLVYAFNASLRFDKRLISQDIAGSKAHVRMLGRCGILPTEDVDAILEGLEGILRDVEKGNLTFSSEYEDVHSFVEAHLTERIGEAGKKLHTGRSRNDQVALDMKLYAREQIDVIYDLLYQMEQTLMDLIKDNTDTPMPGFTHLQKAQPVTLAHHLGAYFEMFRRDMDRLRDTRRRLNECPLGSGALAGTTYPLDRNFTAAELKFDRPTRNSMDAVSDRDYLIELLGDLSIIMMHFSRLSEEVIIWNSDEYRFVEISDAYSTGSSIMPQKKNPDIAELTRGKCGRVYGDLFALLTVMKGIPLAYDKDLQEDKESAFDAIDTVSDCIMLNIGMFRSMRFNADRMRRSATGGFTNATDVADYLVGKGVAFRDAHRISGEIVLYCIDRNKNIEDLTLQEFQKICPSFEDDIYQAISLESCINRRLTVGAPGAGAMAGFIEECEKFLSSIKEQKNE